jgi:hypothetical protein
VLWDEPIQDYDCHFADHTEDRQLKVKDLWGDTLSDTLMEFLRVQPRSAPIKTVYDLLSESLYQSLFKWERIQNAAVYHRIFQGVSGPDILDPLTRVLATKISGFTNGTYGKGWQPRGDEDQVEFGFESKVGEDALATREGDFERVRKHLLKQKPWLKSLPKHIVRL